MCDTELERLAADLRAAGLPLLVLTYELKADRPSPWWTHHNFNGRMLMVGWTVSPSIGHLDRLNRALAGEPQADPVITYLKQLGPERRESVVLEVVASLLKGRPALAKKLGVPVPEWLPNGLVELPGVLPLMEAHTHMRNTAPTMPTVTVGSIPAAPAVPDEETATAAAKDLSVTDPENTEAAVASLLAKTTPETKSKP